MNNDELVIFFNKLIKKLALGEIIEGPIQVTGGLTHKMYKIFTSRGKYIVKLLNPNIMKRTTALANFKRADILEETLKSNNINAIYSLIFNNSKLQKIDNQYLYIYEWFEGKTLTSKEITEEHCIIIAKSIAEIHNINLINKNNQYEKKHINFNKYLEYKSPINKLLKDNIDLLNNSIKMYNNSIKKLPPVLSICHNDMDIKNVLWNNHDYKIIDLECLDYSNPYLELFELALCWTGFEECNINYELLNIFLKTYFENTNLNKNIDWESIYYVNSNRIDWLEYNIKRVLMIETNSKEEQEIGINEVIKTIKQIKYYNEIKEKLLNNIKKIIEE